MERILVVVMVQESRGRRKGFVIIFGQHIGFFMLMKVYLNTGGGFMNL